MEELDLRELFSVFWEKRVYFILLILIFSVIGAIYTMTLVTPKYQSETKLVLVSDTAKSTTDSITTTDITLNSKLVSTYSEIIKSKTVIRQVISNLGLDLEYNEIKKNVSVTAGEDAEVIKIVVTNKDAVYAYKIANEIARVFIEKASELYKINNVNILDEAEVAEGPSNINHIKDIVIFAFIGAIIAVGYVLISNMLDNTVKNAESIEKNLKLSVLAVIPLNDNDGKKGGRK